MLAVNCKGKGMELKQGTQFLPTTQGTTTETFLWGLTNTELFYFGGDPKLGQKVLSRDCAGIYFRSQSTILRSEEIEAVRGDKAAKILRGGLWNRGSTDLLSGKAWTRIWNYLEAMF